MFKTSSIVNEQRLKDYAKDDKIIGPGFQPYLQMKRIVMYFEIYRSKCVLPCLF